MLTTLTETHARTFARMTLGHLGLRYPYKLDLVLTGPEDAVEPAVRSSPESSLIPPFREGPNGPCRSALGRCRLPTIGRCSPQTRP